MKKIFLILILAFLFLGLANALSIEPWGGNTRVSLDDFNSYVNKNYSKNTKIPDGVSMVLI